MKLLQKWLAVSLVIAVAPQLLDGVVVDGFSAAAMAAVVYGALYVIVGWLVSLVVGVLSIVPGVLTLGLFFFLVPLIVHTVLLKWTASIMESFDIHSWGDAFLLSALLSVVGFIFDRRERRDRD